MTVKNGEKNDIILDIGLSSVKKSSFINGTTYNDQWMWQGKYKHSWLLIWTKMISLATISVLKKWTIFWKKLKTLFIHRVKIIEVNPEKLNYYVIIDDLKKQIVISFELNYDNYDSEIVNKMFDEEIENTVFKKEICDNL